MQPVYTLLCKRDLPMAMATLPRIITFLSPGQKLIVADDGSFDQDTIEKVSQVSEQIQVILLKEREEVIMQMLKGLPNCLRYRNEFPLAFKLLDIPLLAQKENARFTFTDSDIIYLKNCHSYFNQNVNTYLKTDAIKLSVKLQNGLLKYKWKLPLRFNSGYFSFNTSQYDLEFIEYFLGLPDVRNSPWLSEQTCWSLLFGRSGVSFCPLENEFVCRENFAGPKSDTYAVHLIGNLKNCVTEWSKDLLTPDEIARMPRFDKSRNVTLVDWLKKTASRLT